MMGGHWTSLYRKTWIIGPYLKGWGKEQIWKDSPWGFHQQPNWEKEINVTGVISRLVAATACGDM